MSKNRFLDLLNHTELGKLLDDVPLDLKLDIVHEQIQNLESST